MSASPELFLSENADHDILIKNYTSGSTGTPMTFYKDRREVFVADMLLWNMRRKWAADIARIPMLRFYVKRAVGGHITSDPYYFDERGVNVSLLHLNEDTFEACWAEMIERGYKDLWLFGSPSALLRMAAHYKRTRYRGLGTIKFIELSGETVFADQQQFISDAFGCPAANQYGTAEFWGIAYECQMGSLHVFDNHVYVEVVDKRGVQLPYGTEGEIIVTGLDGFAMPFLRYRVGDRGELIPSQCNCGNKSDVLRLTGSRIAEYIATPSGTSVNSVLIYYIVSKVNSKGRKIHQFQAVQRGFDLFTIRLALTSVAFKSIVEPLFKAELSKHLRYPVRIDFEYPSDFSQDTKTGKFKYFSSEFEKQTAQHRLIPMTRS